MIVSSFSCTTQDWYDSGVSSPYHDCSIMEYLRKDSYNWELTVKLIERAKLTDMFEGKDFCTPKLFHFTLSLGQ